MKTYILLLMMVLPVTRSLQGQTYVAVGDSLAFGFQEGKFYSLFFSGQYDPGAFNTGFVDVIGGVLRPFWPNLQIANFSCPGETTTTLVSGGCPLHNWLFALPLHQNYPGETPQIFAVAQYLQGHPNQVVFMTVTIGANDILNLFSNCNNDMTCVGQGLPAVSAQAAGTLGVVIHALKLLSPQSVILYTNAPDPYLFTNPASVTAFTAFNAAMGTAATGAGARVVDWFGAQQQLNQATFCVLSYVCQAPLFDIHPTDTGYKVLAIQTIQTLLTK